MKTLKEIMGTPLEELQTLSSDELDLYIEGIEPIFTQRKVNTHVYQFNIKDLLYQVEITESLLADGKKMIEVKFKLMNNPNIPRREDFSTDSQYRIALRKSEIGITGTGSGHVQEIFGNVIGVMINTIKEIRPNYISFTADEDRRQSLYSRLIKLMTKYIPLTYTRISVNPLTGKELGNEEFWLEKV